MNVEQKKENPSSMNKPFVPQYERRGHGRMGSTCLFKGVGTFYLGNYQWTLRTIQLSDPVSGGNYTTHGRMSLPRGSDTISVIRQC
jgi:hypothetical protein